VLEKTVRACAGANGMKIAVEVTPSIEHGKEIVVLKHKKRPARWGCRNLEFKCF
jgi:hypothetical protein